MAKNQISFFSTKTDLESLLRIVETELPLQFVATGLFDRPHVESVKYLQITSSIENTTYKNANHTPSYLVADVAIAIQVRSVLQRGGGMKYAIDQLANPKSIMLKPGCKSEGPCLIAGQLGTISNETISLELFKRFDKKIKMLFAKIKSYYVGNEASELLEKGWRLTANPKAPAIYDLKSG